MPAVQSDQEIACRFSRSRGTEYQARRNHIHLFLRRAKGIEYTYLGLLKYLWHDPTRQRPVHFRWRVLDWHILPAVLKRMALRLRPCIA
jgi:hypothetical protein